MFIDKDSIIINGVSMGQYITEAKYSYNKLWSNDSGRNLAGTMIGTLNGIYPKITLQFAPLTKVEMEIITPILDSADQTVTYYDPTKKANVTIATYTGDYEITNKGIVGKDGLVNEGFSCAFIATRKRR